MATGSVQCPPQFAEIQQGREPESVPETEPGGECLAMAIPLRNSCFAGLGGVREPRPKARPAAHGQIFR
jgi:hypothetical protein